MDLKATLVSKTSKKGEKYYVIVISGFPEDYEKDVFLEKAELALLKRFLNEEKEQTTNPFETL